MDSPKKKSINTPTKSTTLNVKHRRNTTDSIDSSSQLAFKTKPSSSTTHHSHSLRSSQVLSVVSKIKPIDYTSSLETINKRLDSLETKIDSILSLLTKNDCKCSQIHKEPKTEHKQRLSLQNSGISHPVVKSSTMPMNNKAVLSRQATIKPKRTSALQPTNNSLLSPTKTTNNKHISKTIKKNPDQKDKNDGKINSSVIKNILNKNNASTKLVKKEAKPITTKDEEKRKSCALTFKDKLNNLNCEKETKTKSTPKSHTTKETQKDPKDQSIAKDLDTKLSVVSTKTTDKKKEKKVKKANTMKGKFSAFAAELDGSLSTNNCEPQGSFKGSEVLNVSCNTSRELNNSLEHKSLDRPIMKRRNKKTGNGEVKFISRKRM